MIEIRSVSFTVHKKKLTVDQRPWCKKANFETARDSVGETVPDVSMGRGFSKGKGGTWTKAGTEKWGWSKLQSSKQRKQSTGWADCCQPEENSARDARRG